MMFKVLMEKYPAPWRLENGIVDTQIVAANNIVIAKCELLTEEHLCWMGMVEAINGWAEHYSQPAIKHIGTVSAGDVADTPEIPL